MNLADAAALAATVLSVGMLLPQISKLIRTRSAEGVSTTWAAFGAVSNAAWTAYLLSQSLWYAFPSTSIVTVFYGITLILILRTGRVARLSLRLGTVWAATLAAVGAIGGWAALGLVLGLAIGVQMAPSIWTAYRTWAPRGIAPTTWVLAFLESCLWWYYGAFYEDRPILVFAVLAATGALLMLGRYLGTRHRWLTPSKA